MATYLLTWNPNRYQPDETVPMDQVERWSCGRTQRMVVGDRLLMLRQGVEPRGLVGIGEVIRPPFYAPHWDDTEQETLYVGTKWAYLQPFPVIPQSILSTFEEGHWEPQSSGMEIKEEATAEQLTSLFHENVKSGLFDPERKTMGEQKGLSNIITAIPILQAIELFDQLGKRAFLNRFGYRPAKGYFLEYNGKRYDSKAIMGVAHQYARPDLGPLTAAEFSGGQKTVQTKLEGLGFQLLVVGEKATARSNTTWDSDEIERVIESYMEMLAKELAGEPFKKSAYNQRLQEMIGRSRGSIEFKHQNISAILDENGYRYIQGYKPMNKYQAELKSTVLAWATESDLFDQVDDLPGSVEEDRLSKSWRDIFCEPPPHRSKVSKPKKRRFVARKVDFKGVNEARIDLGRAGERFIYELEKQRLTEEGRSDLAEKVVWVSETEGDGAGYDILSFETDGEEIYIEVKTTNSGRYQPFEISANELPFSKLYRNRYRLYRVYNFQKGPQVFVIQGDLEAYFELTPSSFRAKIRNEYGE